MLFPLSCFLLARRLLRADLRTSRMTIGGGLFDDVVEDPVVVDCLFDESL